MNKIEEGRIKLRAIRFWEAMNPPPDKHWKRFGFEYSRLGAFSGLTFMSGLFRFLRMGRESVVMICGLPVFVCILSPEVESVLPE